MNTKSTEKGQVLIIIALAAVVLVGFSALALDGARVFDEKRHAQNAADTAAMAGALAYSRNYVDDAGIESLAQERAADNGYIDQNTAENDVTVTVTDTTVGDCPFHLSGKEVKVEIVTTINTTLTRVLGRQTMSSKSTAVSRACGTYSGPPFDGNAIVSLAPSGLGFDAKGTPDFYITGGGIFVNSTSNPSTSCNGDADVITPGVTTAGGTSLPSGCYTGPPPTTGTPPFEYADYSALFPRQPACNGTAYSSGGQWHPQPGADGSTVSWSGNKDFAPGLYCVTNSPGPFHDAITGSEVTFFITDPGFKMSLNGGGTLTATAPTSGEYKGVLIYMKPVVINGVLQSTQELDLQGNGTGNVVGSILAPSAEVTMFGNSGTGAFNSQIIAYKVDSGGNADITITYSPNTNYQFTQPYTLSLLE